MEEYVQEVLKHCYIQLSTSPASAGFFFITKKGESLRPCIDYRGLNQITVQYPYPLPLVPSAIEQLCSAQIFIKLGMCNAYNLVSTQPGHEWKTAFSTTSDHYEYTVMPYGPSCAPSVFQCFINDVLRDILSRFVIAYVDDTHLYPSHEIHTEHVKQVLTRLQQYRIYVKGEKCEFSVPTISFLGYIIMGYIMGITMDQSKVQAVTEWPTPQTVKDLQCFLGLAVFYRCFIWGFSSIATLLTVVLKKGPKKLSWNSDAEKTFHKLKTSFITAPSSNKKAFRGRGGHIRNGSGSSIVPVLWIKD